MLAKEGRFEGSCAPESQTVIVTSNDTDTILVPSGENATDVMPLLWAFVFFATHLMSAATILRTRERSIERLRLHACIRQHGDMGPQAAWRHGATSGCKKLEGRLTCLDADMQQPTAAARMRGIAWLRSSSRTESRMPSREAAQLKASGLGSHVAVKRAGMEGREAYWSAAARDCGKARGKNHSRERDNGTPRMCAPGVRAGHHGGKQLSGLDGCQS